jgi:hypothetical protein
LLSNADFSLKNVKGRLPKEVTKNQRIIYLIEKYEKRIIKEGSFIMTHLEEEKDFYGNLAEGVSFNSKDGRRGSSSLSPSKK